MKFNSLIVLFYFIFYESYKFIVLFFFLIVKIIEIIKPIEIMKSLIIRFLLTVCFMDSVINGHLKCPKHSYSTCNPGKPGHINVHLVSHSHNDLGWTKTVQEYYNGSSSNYRPYYRSHPPITVKSILGSFKFGVLLVLRLSIS